MDLWLIILLPLVGAIIGWCTNWLAVKMIFRPRKPIGLPGIRLMGLLPRRREELAENVARTVEKELLSVQGICQSLESREKAALAGAKGRIGRNVKLAAATGSARKGKLDGVSEKGFELTMTFVIVAGGRRHESVKKTTVVLCILIARVDVQRRGVVL